MVSVGMPVRHRCVIMIWPGAPDLAGLKTGAVPLNQAALTNARHDTRQPDEQLSKGTHLPAFAGSRMVQVLVIRQSIVVRGGAGCPMHASYSSFITRADGYRLSKR
jgi:hypothetical protein